MELLVEIAGWTSYLISAICLLAGAFFAVVGGIGILRMPDFYSRLHGGGVTDTMGAGLIMLGLMFQAGFSLVTVKLIMILFFLFTTSPTACHALAHAAWTYGLKPLSLESEDGSIQQ